MDTLKSDGGSAVQLSTMEHAQSKLRDEYAAALGERIRHCRGSISREEFAKRLDLHVNTVGKFERGVTIPDAHTIIRMAEVGGCKAQWLLTGAEPSSGVKKSVRAVETANYVFVPHFDVQMSAGNGVFSDVETVIAMRPFDIAFIRHDLGIAHNDLALVSVVGNSMEPELRSRDTTLLDLKATDVVTEGVHAIRLDDALMLKKVQRLPGRVLRVSSTNQDYAPFDIAGGDDEADTERDFAVLGRVRWGGKTFN